MVKGDGNIKFTFITDSKREALAYARGLAVNTNGDLIVYGKDGKIASKSSYAKMAGQLSKK